jgi:pyruvate kinase
MRKTKIVCTIGPATNSEEKITQLVKAGMNVARLNFSHSTHEDHEKILKIIRRVSNKLNKAIAILQDLQGPKLRVGKIKNGSVFLDTGSKINIVMNDILGDELTISTTYKDLANDVSVGDLILLDDGLIRLKVNEVKANSAMCDVEEGGILSDFKGINLPGVNVSQISFTEKDQADLRFGIEQGVDFIALSFVRSANDILQAKKIIVEYKKEILVIAKIEKPEAIQNLMEIIDAADGAMIARGDLGVEIPLERIPVLQKKIICLCQEKGKPVIIATQMLESMRQNSRPTRAEVSDVANAIFDGTDAVMLSAETATGYFPIETVKTMDKIIFEAEKTVLKDSTHLLHSQGNAQTIADAVANSACEAAHLLNVKAIVTFTYSGFTARMVSKYRPKIKIIAFTPSEIVRHQLILSWGVTSLKMDYLDSIDEVFNQTERLLLKNRIVKKGDKIVVLLGTPIFAKGTTNLMKIHVVGE